MGRYVLGDRSWSIERDGTTLTITDESGERIEHCADARAATTRFTVLTNQKVREGWKLWREPPAPRAKPVPEAPIVYDAREPALEAAIAADPEAIEPYLVYADWLEAQGDPRGGLIARCVAKHRNPNDPALANTMHARLDRFHDYFFGPVRADGIEGLDWGFGYVRHASIGAEDYHGNLVSSLEALLALGSCRFLVSLALHDRTSDDQLAAALPIVGERAPQTLRYFRMRCHQITSDIDAIAPRLPALKTFELYTPFSLRAIDALAASTLPELTTLGVRVSDKTELGYIATRCRMPALDTLRIERIADGGWSALAGTPLAAQLRTIELRSYHAQGRAWLDELHALLPRIERIGVATVRDVDPKLAAAVYTVDARFTEADYFAAD